MLSFSNIPLSPRMRNRRKILRNMKKAVDLSNICLYNENMNKVINTLRLILRPITLTDAEAIFSWGSDIEVNKTVIYPLYKNIEDVKTWIKSIKESDNEFLITLKDQDSTLVISQITDFINSIKETYTFLDIFI